MSFSSNITALLGPTNTGKTHRAIERMLEHRSGLMGFPLRLLAREVYERVCARVGVSTVALLTGEERQVPPHPKYWICTVEAMPDGLEVDFVAVDEIQLAADRARGHVFTQRLLRSRGTKETWFLGAGTMSKIIRDLIPHVQIERHPRLSELRHGGQVSLSGLAPRSAVIALSSRELYQTAHALRERKGGVAVVLGALSPRTRNAQVELFQSGEVDYLVATDAIGMGLNLDLKQVVFASLSKFDGWSRRDLTLEELAQIAGRAGRAETDGIFSTLKSSRALTEAQVQAIELHRFRFVHRLVWRNDELDFSSMAGLIESLRVLAPRGIFQKIQRADDYEALLWLARRSSVLERCRSKRDVELLWSVCQIPDYRKLLLDQHFVFLETIFAQLIDRGGQIDADWMMRRMDAIDRSDGDIELLMTRLGFIRTWNYVAHRPGWLEQPAVGQARARAIEDRLSDALHEALLIRFSGMRNTLSATPKRPRASHAGARKSRVPRPSPVLVDANHPFAGLQNLAEQLDVPSVASNDDGWLEALLQSGEASAWSWTSDRRIEWDGRSIARLGRGASLVLPELSLDAGLLAEIGAVDGARVLKVAHAFATSYIRALLFHGQDLKTWSRMSSDGHSRALAYQLQLHGGIVAQSQLKTRFVDRRKELATLGFRCGWNYVFARDGFSEQALALRASLIASAWDIEPLDLAPSNLEGAFQQLAKNDIPYWLLGYHVFDDGATMRIDKLESHLLRVLGSLPGKSTARNKSEPPPNISEKEWHRLLGRLGFVVQKNGTIERRLQAKKRSGRRTPR